MPNGLKMLSKFMSRKLFVAVFSMALSAYSLVMVKQAGYNYVETVVVVPSLIVAISVIAVAYITGQAKIEVSQNITNRGKDD